MIFLAGAPCVDVALRQHVVAAGAPTAELVAAGTAIYLSIPVRGLLHQIGVKQMLPLSMYLDSSSTCFLINGNGSLGDSAWLARRIVAMQEQKDNGDVVPRKISEKHNISDKNTKYLDMERTTFLGTVALNMDVHIDGTA